MSVIILAVCVVVIALAAVLAGYYIGAGRTAEPARAAALMIEDTAPRSAPPVMEIIEPPAQSGSIAVPGFDRLIVRGRMLDAEHIHNPERNVCYFVVSITLADGLEVYRSGVLAPGQSVGVVELSSELAPGAYEGVTARYSAFSLDSLSPLNGADIDFILEVLP